MTIFFLLFAGCSGSGNLNTDVTFCAVGDILLDRGVRNVIAKEGVRYPFEKVADYINTCDLAFCNLECPISSRGDPLDKRFVFRADPSFIEGLIYSGFNVYSKRAPFFVIFKVFDMTKLMDLQFL